MKRSEESSSNVGRVIVKLKKVTTLTTICTAQDTTVTIISYHDSYHLEQPNQECHTEVLDANIKPTHDMAMISFLAQLF